MNDPEVKINKRSVATTLQSGILKPDGRDHRRYIFIRLNPNADGGKLRNFLKKIAKKYVTSHYQQELDTRKFKKDKAMHKHIPMVNMGISAIGYLKLSMSNFPRTYPGDESFQIGMRKTSTKLQDYFSWDYLSEKEKCEGVDKNYVDENFFHGYKNRYGEEEEVSGIDLIIIIGHARKSDCKKVAGEICQKLKANPQYIASHFQEKGKQKRDKTTRAPLTPLGFQEGFSNIASPDLIFKRILVRESWLDFSKGGIPTPTYGTYLAFRKIEVRKDHFDELIHEMVVRLKDHGRKGSYKELKAYAKALFMGRFQNGTPLAISDVKLDRAEWNTGGRDIPFDYSSDPSGLQCPIGAHVRRMNPRGSGENNIKIIRRGIRFKEKSTGRRGLLFVSYQGSIVNNLEPLFAQMRAPLHSDAITYRPKEQGDYFAKFFELAPKYNEADKIFRRVKIGGNELTSFRGGEYFFLPSIAYLRDLK